MFNVRVNRHQLLIRLPLYATSNLLKALSICTTTNICTRVANQLLIDVMRCLKHIGSSNNLIRIGICANNLVVASRYRFLNIQLRLGVAYYNWCRAFLIDHACSVRRVSHSHVLGPTTTTFSGASLPSASRCILIRRQLHRIILDCFFNDSLEHVGTLTIFGRSIIDFVFVDLSLHHVVSIRHHLSSWSTVGCKAFCILSSNRSSLTVLIILLNSIRLVEEL